MLQGAESIGDHLPTAVLSHQPDEVAMGITDLLGGGVQAREKGFPRHVQELQAFHDAMLVLSRYCQPVVGIDRNLLVPLQYLVALVPLVMALSCSGIMAWTLTRARCRPTKVRAYHLSHVGCPSCTCDRPSEDGEDMEAWAPAATAEGAGSWRILFSFPLI